MFIPFFTTFSFAQNVDDSALAKQFVQNFYKGFVKGTIKTSSSQYFEPSLFQLIRKVEKFADAVEKQTGEWLAFNDAFSINPDAAMQSTSIGLMQVMGFHYKKLGFATVGAMWDHGKESEANQVDLGLRFIKAAGNEKLFNALKNKDWATFAFYYNGAQYKKFNYDTRMADAYKKALAK